MKTHLTFLLFTLTLASAASLHAQPHSLLTWTSNDHHTIQARFIGVGGQSVLIEKNGTVFNVPFVRLSAQSITQAKRLGAPSAQTASAEVETPTIIEAAKLEPAANQALAAKNIAAVQSVVLAKPMIPCPSLPATTSPKSMQICSLMLAGKTASTTGEVPYAVQRAIEAGNFLQTKPYKWGGGHGSLMDSGYDCSGSVSHVLMQAGLLDSALTSGGFARYGAPGPGKWITIYAGSGHAFMSICGLRLDTGGRGGRGESGPRWCMASRGSAGWTLRHPPGF